MLVAPTHATIGVIVGPVFGRLGGLYLLLVSPFLDIGLAFTSTYDEVGALVLALGWLFALTAIAAAVFQRISINVGRRRRAPNRARPDAPVFVR